MKTLLKIVGAVFLLLVLAAAVVPFVVDVDKYRPQIESVVNRKVNGKLELGKLSLSLWGHIRVQIAGVKLMDQTGNEVLAVNEAYLYVPFSSVFSGAPQVVFKMKNPTLDIVKGKDGKVNLLGLTKKGEEKAPEAAAPTGQPAAPTGGVTLPAMAVRAKLDVELTDAHVVYLDKTTGLSTKINDLNLRLNDVSLSHPMNMEAWADLDTKMGQTLVVKGHALFKGTAKPAISDGQLEHLDLNAKMDLDQLEIRIPGVFEKNKGLASNAELALVASPKEAKIQSLTAHFFNAELKAAGSIENLSGAPVVNLGIKSNSIELKPWVELIPSLKEYELGGAAQMEAGVNGPVSKLGYSATIKVAALTAKAPKLKAQPRIDGAIHVITDQIDSMTLAMKAPGNDLQVHGKVVSFTKPHADFQVTSNEMNLDQLVDLTPPSAATGGSAQSAQGSASTSTDQSSGKAGKTDLDKMMAPIRENKMMRELAANIGVNIKSLKAYDIKVTDIASRMSFRDLVAAIDQFGMKVWGGQIKASAGVDFKPAIPNYKFGSQVDGLDMAQAVASQFHLFRNTVVGKAHFAANGQGASFNAPAALQNLSAKGSMRIEKATFASIDVGKMVSDGLNQSIAKIAQKIPPLANKRVGAPPNQQSKYEFISSSFTISGGKFVAPDFTAKAEPKQGFDMKGDATVGLVDYSLKARVEVVDNYNLTHAADISAPAPTGGEVSHVLAERGGPVKFPVSVGCTLNSPCYNYTEVPEYLAKVAMNNMTGAATGRAKAELKKQAEGVIQQAPPSVQNQLNNLSKKLFGR